MDMSKTTFGIIGVAIAVILIAVLVIPVVEESGYTRVYEDNAESAYRYDVVGSLELSYDGTNLQPYGAVSDLPVNSVIMFTDTMRMVYSANRIIIVYMNDGNYTQQDMASGDVYNFSNGMMTLDFASGTEVVQPYKGDVISYDADGDYISVRDASDVTLKYRSDKPVYFMSGTGQFLSYGESRDVASGRGVMQVTATGSTIEVDLTWSAVADADGVYTIGQTSFVVDDNTYEPAFFAPYQYYTLEKGDSVSSVLFSVVPMLMVVSVVVMAARLLAGRD